MLDKTEDELKNDERVITDEEAPRKVGLIIGIIVSMIGVVSFCLCIYKK